jgi:hypothetical protein
MLSTGTGADGRFELEMPAQSRDEAHVIVNAVGYPRDSFRVHTSGELNLQLPRNGGDVRLRWASPGPLEAHSLVLVSEDGALLAISSVIEIAGEGELLIRNLSTRSWHLIRCASQAEMWMALSFAGRQIAPIAEVTPVPGSEVEVVIR